MEDRGFSNGKALLIAKIHRSWTQSKTRYQGEQKNKQNTSTNLATEKRQIMEERVILQNQNNVQYFRV